MAEEKEKLAANTERLFAREYNTAKERSLKFYSNVDDAVNDPDPRLKMFVHKVTIELLGEIRLVLIPVAGEAVRALVTVGKPREKPKRGSK